ncbi:DUF262 domain-containing protein [Shinella sp. AETb1-6]|uniref:DUF262 domain-containing protein n=1 Tax=Shinella sp. AETb1-6 TaxID=2692210 RepID=UPI00136EBA00|nr:DUF262 domain-containing protein [Shinella sp. AETb1-6]MXN53141.1 DUF262 domain-containing protein [Shinella sp. AETb1-6]
MSGAQPESVNDLFVSLPAPVVEPEETESDVVKPWDPKQIRITTKNFTIREIFSQIQGGELDLAPDFQRSFVWKDRQQIRLIESILLGIPLPAFYFNQDSQGAHQVIDGVQRLTTVKLFMLNALSLQDSHLEYLKDLRDLTYDTLEAPIRRRFASTQIVAHVIEPQTPDEVKYDIFNRVNTGGSPLTPQEIRHCMSKTTSRAFLQSLVERESFDRATSFAFWSKAPDGLAVRDNQRMADREMALRFCAFRSVSIDDYAKANSLDGFLLDFTRQMDAAKADLLSSLNLAALEAAFEQSMQNCAAILGEAAFRRWPPQAARRGPINRAIFEAQALALADYDLQALLPYRDEIVAGFRRLFDNAAYDSSVRAGTGDVRKVERRLAMTRDCVRAIVT